MDKEPKDINIDKEMMPGLEGAGAGKGRKSRNIRKIIMIACVCAIAAAGLIAGGLTLFGEHEEPVTILDKGTAIKGVSLGGIDISEMTREEALAATASLEDDTLASIKFTLDVNGEEKEYSADFFCVVTDYEDALESALDYGHNGSFEDRRQCALNAQQQGVDFKLSLSVDEERLKQGLELLSNMLNVAPVDASLAFTPWGHLADGSEYTPDIKAMVKNYASGKTYDMPELATLDESEKPNPLRYKFWENNKYIDGYIPAAADISRFVYTSEIVGYAIDTDYILEQVVEDVAQGSFSKIVVPCEVLEPAITVADLKENTGLIASWSSSFSKSSHYNYNRNWNVAMMAALINGAVIEPGMTWSVNDTAGPRDDTTAKTVGWRKAAGLENGGTTQQVGGGVCQLGSTTYNAAIRSGITIAESNHHSIPSDYIPLGLDATLNTKPNLDLKLKNDKTLPYYVVAYVNPKDKNVTVEIYGPKPVDPTYGEVIYDYSYKNLGRTGSPKMKTITVSSGFETPDGKIINDSLPVYEYASPRRGTKVQTYIHIISLAGEELNVSDFNEWEYPDIDGTTYKLKEETPSGGGEES